MSSRSWVWLVDGVPVDPPLLPFKDWKPWPVARGTVRMVSVVIDGFYGISPDPLLVAWDDSRATVRLPTGELRWYEDGSGFAFPEQDGIVVEDHHSGLLPRDNRYRDALAVRSLEDLVETVNAEKLTSIDEDGTIHMNSEHDTSRGQALRDPASGIIVKASGTRRSPWRLDVKETRLITEDQDLLEPIHLPPPNI